MWTPTHILVTVLKAKGLLEKGKGGNDAYCIIGLGKEKYLTSVKQKTLTPSWDEQAEFSLNEKEDLKITVYHKSSIIDEFLGRVLINIQELSNDNINTHTKWYKLQSKPDKEQNSKKAEKDRGQLEIRIDFLVKPKSGSCMDLSKSKDKSLSIKSLKDKSLSIRHSIGDKLQKALHKKSKSKYSAENQLAEQSKRMGGSKLSFLDDADENSSFNGSYSSLNSSNLQQRGNELKQVNTNKLNSNNNYSPRSSIISENTSFNERIIDADESNMSLDKHQINKYKRTTSEISATIPQSASTPAIKHKETVSPKKEQAPKIAPSLPQVTKIIVDTPTISVQPTSMAPAKPPRDETKLLNDSFASLFQQQMDSQLPPLPPTSSLSRSNSIRSRTSPLITTTTTLAKSNSKYTINKKQNNTNSNNNSFIYDDDQDDNDDDVIDWESSDEEIVKQEIETFQRNQVPVQTNPFLDASSCSSSIPLVFLNTNPFLCDILINNNKMSDTEDNQRLEEIIEEPKELENKENQEIDEELKENDSLIIAKPFNDMFLDSENTQLDNNTEIIETIDLERADDIDTNVYQHDVELSSSSSSSSSTTSRAQSPNINIRKIDLDENFDNYFAQSEQQDNDTSLNKQDEDIINEEAEIEKSTIVEEETTSLRQSERRRIVPNHDLTSDLNSDNDFNDSKTNLNIRNSLSINLNDNKQTEKTNKSNVNGNYGTKQDVKATDDDDIKTPDIDIDYVFQENVKNFKQQNTEQHKQGSGHAVLPDILNPKGSVDSIANEKAKQKYIDSLDGVKLSDVVVPDNLRKQLEYFDREELLQLITYQKKFLDDKESRIKDLDNYIDNLVLRIIEIQPSILMQAGGVLARK